MQIHNGDYKIANKTANKTTNKTAKHRLIGEIMLVISGCPEGEAGKPLGEEYLMGYYLQKNALYTKKNNDNNESEEKES